MYMVQHLHIIVYENTNKIEEEFIMFKKKSLLLIVVLIVLFTAMLGADDKANKFIIGETRNINSDILEQEREVIVYLPIGYENGTNDYPVLYLLDGGFHFHHVSGIVSFLSSQGLMPQTIVVAIKNIDRNKDFLPTNLENVPTSGGGENFQGFISEELMPFIDKNYRTNKYNILVGHSFGGAFTAYTFLEKPDLFNAYIAISPYMHWDNELLVKLSESAIKDSYNSYKFFYMTLGDEPPYIPAIEKFQAIIDKKEPENLDFTFTQMLKETHGSIPHLSIYNGLLKLFSDWQLSRETLAEGIEAVDAHYQNISNKYGFEMETPEMVINMIGYQLMFKEEFKKAIKVFQENVKRFPTSANVYDSLGEAFEKNNQLEKAKENFARACEIATMNDPNRTIYKKNLNRVSDKLME